MDQGVGTTRGLFSRVAGDPSLSHAPPTSGWKHGHDQPDDPNLQLKNRAKAIAQADFVVPGHGPMFKVTEELRQKVLSDAEC